MILKATVGGVRCEIWFTPSFNIKTTDKTLESLLRTMELEVFDPWEMRMRKMKATKGIKEAYLIIDELKIKVPELRVKIEEAPELPAHYDEGTKENPVTH
ncbi:hypothetical protein BpsS36_00006 [Bacillus phage vB_BpsS-36]|uniref:Uncharacterized protein n=1 Tax=Bacillus phage vB_BpsS-36 TaxID=2419622 RepID=A0A3G3BWP0_9CAUD|nr:hypothetical protein BpsS36_00006 [Bacillus phage vB_BpsS-36]